MKIIGHRGARGLAPENTIASLKKALEYGVDEIEIDVRITKDHIVILNHDPAIYDHGGSLFPISDSTYEQLKAIKHDLTTLEEAMRAVNHKVPILIEIKPEEPTAPLVKTIKKLLNNGSYTNDMLLGSFSQKTLRELQLALPQIDKVVIEHWSGVRASIRARESNTKRLSIRSWWLWTGFIGHMARRGYKIAPYTLDNPRTARRWARHGLYAVITDYPDRYRSKNGTAKD